MAARSTRKGSPIKVNAENCVGCLICELRCSLRFEKAFNPALAKIKVQRLVDADSEYAVSFTDDCDRCGICARHCLYDVLVQEKRRGVD